MERTREEEKLIRRMEHTASSPATTLPTNICKEDTAA